MMSDLIEGLLFMVAGPHRPSHSGYVQEKSNFYRANRGKVRTYSTNSFLVGLENMKYLK
jgi:hypothetical protein